MNWNGELNGEMWDVGNSEYHADRSCDSSSTLKIARKSLQLYESLYVKGQAEHWAGSPEMTFGSAFHCALLEPGEFSNRYTYEPDDIDGEPINKRLKAHREYLAEFSNGLGSREALPSGDKARIESMLASVKSFHDAAELLKNGRAELGVKFKIDGHPLKALMDWSCEKTGVVLDVKTTRHAGTMDTFRREIESREYHCQAALYCEAFLRLYGDVPEFYWLFVHTAPPYETYLFKMGKATREIGLEITRKTISELKVAKALAHFKPQAYGSAREIELPDWVLRKHDKGSGGSEEFGN